MEKFLLGEGGEKKRHLFVDQRVVEKKYEEIERDFSSFLRVTQRHPWAYYVIPSSPSLHLVEGRRKMIKKLNALLNVRAELTLYRWFGEEVIGGISNIALDQVELFPLEGSFRDYLHEVQSGTLLRELAKTEEGLSLTEIFTLRNRLQTLRNYHVEKLKEIDRCLTQLSSLPASLEKIKKILPLLLEVSIGNASFETLRTLSLFLQFDVEIVA